MDKCGEHRKNTDRSHQHDGVYDGMAQAASPRPRHGQQALRARSGPPAPSRRPRGHRQYALRGLAYDAGAEAAVAEVGAPCRLG